VELGVEVAAVRNYRHIISAPARLAAQRQLLEAKIQSRLVKGALDEDIAAELGVELRQVKNERDRLNERIKRACAPLPRRARPIPAVCASPSAPPDAAMPIALGLTAALLTNHSHATPAPPADFSSGGGGDFGGGGASSSFDQNN
jgi:hypothetical protein